eukprot:CAMPEP_0172581322 /NCGR_PEP_ID=MMETSP1068-20121228/548_1 /TAXON_ID=35684 /ORGANISM="Pseudopedinella elastica, Strain CCMP716" /LENGTH=70 /DNA_ID=CAMNT_0013374265 /DNA_START=106 /DNA_END=318 /DNA_ORIENTATION=+
MDAVGPQPTRVRHALGHCRGQSPMLFTPSATLVLTVFDTLFDVPDLSMAPLNSSRPLPSWTADEFTLIVA